MGLPVRAGGTAALRSNGSRFSVSIQLDRSTREGAYAPQWRRRRASLFCHVVVDFVRPGADAAFDALEVLETLLLEKSQRFHRANAALAMNVVLLVRIQLSEFLRERA